MVGCRNDTYQWPFFWQLKHTSSPCGPDLFLFPPGTTVIFQFSHYFQRFSSTWLFNNEVLSVDEGFAVHLLDGSLCCFMIFIVDECVGMFQDDIFDVSEFWKFALEIRFISSSTKLSYVDLSEIFGIFLSLIMPIATPTSTIWWTSLSLSYWGTLLGTVPSRWVWHI